MEEQEEPTETGNWRLCASCRELVTQRFGSSQLPASLAKDEAGDCQLCQGLFLEVEDFAQLVKKSMEEYEYSSFLLGLVMDQELLEKEKAMAEGLGIEEAKEGPSRLEKALKIAIGTRLEELTAAQAEFERPDVMAILDTRYDDVRLQLSSIHIYGRYRKLERGIPQTEWHCRKCRGKGCHYCEFTGKMYQDSVQELIAGPVLEVAKGTKASFHGMGREDIDARMLGNGRPFVLEIKEPKKRTLDYQTLEKTINEKLTGRVEVEGLRNSDHKEIVKIKGSDHAKRYLVVASSEKPLDQEELKKAITALNGATIQQQTPKRVKHRRANKVRERKVYEISARQTGEMSLEIEVKGESGIYIKELIHGDKGRTQPNLSGLMDNQCTVESLDVLWVYDEE
jgi:tRNA pseudouridine synthase 10